MRPWEQQAIALDNKPPRHALLADKAQSISDRRKPRCRGLRIRVAGSGCLGVEAVFAKPQQLVVGILFLSQALAQKIGGFIVAEFRGPVLQLPR